MEGREAIETEAMRAEAAGGREVFQAIFASGGGAPARFGVFCVRACGGGGRGCSCVRAIMCTLERVGGFVVRPNEERAGCVAVPPDGSFGTATHTPHV